MTATDATVTVDQLAVWPIDDLDGREARLLVVEVPSGVHAPTHHHDGWQFVYVLDGVVTSQMDGEPAEHYETGQAWYERHEQRHLAFGNDGDVTARVLVFYLTRPGHPVLSFDAD
jgi:quercetin dioxygenase-like cupin family protein